MRYCVIILLVLVAGYSSAQSSKKNIKTGDEFYEAERYNEALHFYELAYPDFQDDASLNHKIANCYAHRSNGKKCLFHINKTVKSSKDTTKEMYYTLARAYHLTHKFTIARQLYIKSDPGRTNHKEIDKKVRECDYGLKYISKPVKVKITNMGNQINTKYHEVLPQITADMMHLYFTSHRPGSIGGSANPEDIYVSYNKGGAWLPPANAGAPLNTENNDACIGISNDGQTMFLFKGSNNGDIYMSELKGDKWSKPQPLPFNTEYRETSASLSPDGKTLYFVRKAGGRSRIYQVRRTSSGRWSKPVALSRTINDIYDVESPYMHADGKTLYFSSKGHTSMGGYDIFKSVKTSKGWSKPINLGYPINTAGDDWGFVLGANGQFGYYASAKEGGYGQMDLYTIRMPPPKRKPQLALLKGKVTEEFTDKPVEAEITITDNKSNEVVGKYKSNAKTGEYLISLPSGKNYGVAIEKAGHLFHSENVYLSYKDGFKELKKDIKLVNVKKGAKVVLNNIFFDVGKSDLRPESSAELNRLVDIMNKQPTLKIEISGHTDNVGNAELNQTLSESRAQSVVKFLVEKGISESRLTAVGYGSTKPVAPNTTAEGRQKNRRTEFQILEE